MNKLTMIRAITLTIAFSYSHISWAQDTIISLSTKPVLLVLNMIDSNVEISREYHYSIIDNKSALKNGKILIICTSTGPYSPLPRPYRIELVNGEDTMKIDIYNPGDTKEYFYYIDNVPFVSGNYEILINQYITYNDRGFVCGGREYNCLSYHDSNNVLPIIGGKDYFPIDREVYVKKVFWNPESDIQSMKYVSEYHHTQFNGANFKILPIHEVKFYYVNLAPSSVFIQGHRTRK